MHLTALRYSHTYPMPDISAIHALDVHCPAAGSPAEAAYLVLRSLVAPQHGDVATTSALCMMRLLPTLMGVCPPGFTSAAAAARRGGAAPEGSLRRAAAVQFTKWLCE